MLHALETALREMVTWLLSVREHDCGVQLVALEREGVIGFVQYATLNHEAKLLWRRPLRASSATV
jgi:hypothetical protein